MEDQPNTMAGPTRDGNGQFTRDPTTVARDAEAATLRSRGLTYRQIAAQLGIHPASAHEAVKRAMAEIITEPAEEAIAFELERLDHLHRAALQVLEENTDGIAPLAAIDRLLKISESRRKLLGLDQPAKTVVTGGVEYRIVGVTPDDLT